MKRLRLQYATANSSSAVCAESFASGVSSSARAVTRVIRAEYCAHRPLAMTTSAMRRLFNATEVLPGRALGAHVSTNEVPGGGPPCHNALQVTRRGECRILCGGRTLPSVEAWRGRPLAPSARMFRSTKCLVAAIPARTHFGSPVVGSAWVRGRKNWALPTAKANCPLAPLARTTRSKCLVAALPATTHSRSTAGGRVLGCEDQPLPSA